MHDVGGDAVAYFLSIINRRPPKNIFLNRDLAGTIAAKRMP
jgi:hypothetical protein